MTSDEKHENQENKDIQSNTLDQETRANSNSTERTDTEKVEKTEQQTTNENLEAESDTELPPKPEGQAELEAKQAEGYEHVSESAVNLHHVGELEPSDIPPSLGGEAEINFPWDEEDTADAELSEENETEEAELPAKTEEAELPAETEDAAVPAEAEETQNRRQSKKTPYRHRNRQRSNRLKRNTLLNFLLLKFLIHKIVMKQRKFSKWVNWKKPMIQLTTLQSLQDKAAKKMMSQNNRRIGKKREKPNGKNGKRIHADDSLFTGMVTFIDRYCPLFRRFGRGPHGWLRFDR